MAIDRDHKAQALKGLALLRGEDGYLAQIDREIVIEFLRADIKKGGFKPSDIGTTDEELVLLGCK